MIPVVVVVFASGTRPGSAQPPVATPSQAALAEAERLDTQVEQLDKQGKFAEAVPLAEYSLSLRETQLGARHPAVAASLKSLADLHGSLSEYEIGRASCRER